MRATTALGLALACSATPAARGAPWSLSCGSPRAEWVADMAVLPDGDLALAGRIGDTTAPDATGDLLVMRFGPGGELRWARTYGGPLDDGGLGIAARSDGTLVVAGFTGSFGSVAPDLWLLMLTPAGDVTWERTLGERAGADFGDICALSDDRVMLVAATDGPGGLRNADGCIVTVDPGGRIAQSSWGGDLEETLNRVAAMPSGGVILAGFSPPQEKILVRIDAAGDVTWEGSLLPYQALRSIREIAASADGGALVLAESPWNPSSEIIVAKIDADGAVAWARRTASSTGEPIGIVEMPDGRIAWAATTWGSDGNADVLLVEMDAAGDLLRQQVVGGGGIESGGSLAGRLGGALRLLAGTDLVVAVATQPAAGSLPDAWITRVPADWSTAACAQPVTPPVRFLPLLLETERRPRELARPSAQPARTTATVGDLGVTMGDPCLVAPCGTVVPPEVSGAPWIRPLRVRSGGLLTWDDSRQSCESYAVRRGLLSSLRAGNRGTCLVTGLAAPEHADPDLPGIGVGWFYLVTRVSAAGEGSLGSDSFGVPRVAGTPCR